VSAQLEGFLEGPVTNVKPDSGTLKVNGVKVTVPAGIPIESPTVDLVALAAQQGEPNVLNLLLGANLPGRTDAGFVNGTCLCETSVNPANGKHTMVAMVLEPAENVLLGTVTTHNCVTASCDPDDDPANELRVSKILMDPNTDARLTSDAVRNRGFELDLSQGNLVGAPTAAEGYYGKKAGGTEPERQLHPYVIDVDGGVLLNAGTTEVSVERAQCRDRGDGEIEWGVRGFTHDPDAGIATFRRGDTLAVIGTVAVVADAEGPGFGIYDFDVRALLGSCADTVIVEFGTASTTSPVAVRIDED